MSFITFPKALFLLYFVAMASPGFAETPSSLPLGKTQQLAAPDQVPEGLQKSDWTSIRMAYEAGQHEFKPIAGGWQARNLGQQWTTKFDGRGFLATPRDGDWTWGLELKSYGRGDLQRKVGGQPAVKADGQKLSYQWDATVQEWWVNDQRGLEHGYTLAQRPGPQDASDPEALTLLIGTRGTLTPKVTPDALGVSFCDASGTKVLNYVGLKVWDANGKVLASRFEAAGETSVRLLVEEHGARYPLTIDPIAQQVYLKASNTGSGDNFGESVAVSGDTVVVGASYERSNATGVGGNESDNSAIESGAVYIFTRTGNTWTQQAYLKASNTDAGDRFGFPVAVSGDTVVVGAYGEDSNATGVGGNQFNNSALQSGAAYVFIRNGTTWAQQAYLKASSTEAGDQFGISVAVSSDTVVVGANSESSNSTGVGGNQSNNSALQSGAAYVFTRTGTTWAQQAYLKASNTGAGDRFGFPVAVSGNTVIVGASAEGSMATGVNGDQFNNSALQSGAAYVFIRNGTTWTQQAYLKASNTEANDFFGLAVALSGDTAVVGAPYEDSNARGANGNQADNDVNSSGASYVFTRNGTTWTQQAYLKASNTGYQDVFGLSVAVSGDTVVVGASAELSSATGVDGNQADNSGGTNTGAAYVFTRNGTNWTQQAYLKASNSGAGDIFGYSVAVSGATVVIGAMNEDSNATGVNALVSGGSGTQADDSILDAGAAYIFAVLSPPTVNSPTATSITATESVLGGNVISDGNEIITERGLVYSATSINSDPLIDGTGVVKVIETGTTGVFTVPVTGLIQGTNYSFKAYAINNQGTSYSSVGTFTTPSTNADLSALTISSGTLNPAFASGITAYAASVSGASASMTVTPTRAQVNATIEVRVNGGQYAIVTSRSASGVLPLNVGTNIVEVRVIAEDGLTQKIYTVTVTRANLIQNLVVAQRAGTRLVDLTYDLEVASPVKITVEISSDGGKTYFVPAYALTGDVGLNMASGNSKTITWDAGADWPGNLSDQMCFRVVADGLSDGFSYIPEGPFTMGNTSGDSDPEITDAPPVSVYVSSFCMDKYKVTKALWDEVRTWGLANGYTDLPTGAGKAADHPVHNISWYATVKWCNARSQKDGLTPCYTVASEIYKVGNIDNLVCDWSATGYRLPTEAEREKAARGGLIGKRFPWGDTITHNQANYYSFNTISYDVSATMDNHPTYATGSFPYTSPIGSFASNDYGLYDIAGNVWDWCWDWYSASYYVNGASDPRGQTSGAARVSRGGWWGGNASSCRAAHRNASQPVNAGGSGFRLVQLGSSQFEASTTSSIFTFDNRNSQTITFAAITDKLATDSVNLTATGSDSGNPVTFAVTSGPAVITNNVLTFTTSGSVTVKASQAGNDNYLAAPEVSRSFTVTKTEAPITLAQLTQVANGTPRPVTVSTTPAGLTVTTLYAGSATAPTLPGSYAVTTTIDSLLYQGTASSTLTVLGLSGLEQAILSGSTTPVFTNGTDYGNVTLGRVLTRVFTLLNPGAQPVSLSGNPLVEIEGADTDDFQVSALPETVIPAGGSVAFEVRFAPTQPGLRTAQVKLASAAIANGPISFAVQGVGLLPAPRAQTLTFAPPATVYLSQPSLQLRATASSGLPVSLRVISGPATLDPDGLLNLTLPGTVKIEARQAGNGSFAAAPALLRTITVKADPTTLTLVDLIKTYNGEQHQIGIVGANAFDVEVTYRVGTTYREEPPVNAGHYPVKAVAGAVTKTGTLIINPAPLYVNVEDKRRLVGEDNPALTVLFDGFIGTDNLGLVLSKSINLATTASKTSPVGSYAITSSGGAVTTNYKLVHRPGTLVVEGVAGSYEALLKHPESGLPNGHLALTVPAASRTFTASLRLGQESASMAYSGNLTLSAESRLATATLSKKVSGVTYELKVVLSMFGELKVEVSRAGELVAGADDGIRLLTLPTGQKSPQEGSYTAILEPALPAGQGAPVGAGWATAKVDATGKLTLTGKLADGATITAGMAADVAGRPGYRFFVQPYAALRKDSYVGGSFTLMPHPRLAGKSYVAGSDLTWVKAGQLKDLGYRSGFGPVTSILRIDPWQAPTTTNRLAARLELGLDGRWQVEHSQTGSLSHEALPRLVAVSATNVVSVLTPLTNPRKWKMTITPATGAYSGSFELQELTESRKVNFSGVLRQPSTVKDDLIGAGHYLQPALKAAPSNEQTSGAVFFWRPE